MKIVRVVSLGYFAVAAMMVTDCHSSSSSSSSGDVPEGGTPGGGGCTDATTCTGYGNVCYSSVTCTDGKCAFKLQNYGFQIPDAQTRGDCNFVACDGFGNRKSLPDDLDRPDAGPCKVIFCVNGASHDPVLLDDGTSCGAGLVCTGGLCDAGHD